MYTVYWVAGERDGETLAEFSIEAEAIMFAKKFYEEHEGEFDPCCGGVGIEDERGRIVEW